MHTFPPCNQAVSSPTCITKRKRKRMNQLPPCEKAVAYAFHKFVLLRQVSGGMRTADWRYGLKMKPQGPQGCVSTVFTDNLSTAIFVLETLISEYPESVKKMRTKSISTKVIECIFALTRQHNVTPDPFEFGQIFTKLVKQHVLRCSGNSDFLYILNPRNKSYYEDNNCFLHIEVPPLPPRNYVQITPAQLELLRDFKAIKYLQGVRQNAIRNSNTKHRAGTLPEYAYLVPQT